VRVELAIDREALIERVRQEYALDIERLTFLPKGEVSYCYIAHCTNEGGRPRAPGERCFLKLLDDSRLARWSANRLDFYLPLTWNLYVKGLFQNIPYPIKTRTGEFKTSFEGKPLILFSFIEGKTLEDGFPRSDKILATLARSLAIIHKSTSDIGLEIPYVEGFDIGFESDLLNGLQALERIDRPDNRWKRALRDLVLPRQQEILGYLGRLRELQDPARAAGKEMVLCHTDPTGGNLMITDEGELYILDWEGAMLAPLEHDLFFFAGEEHFDRFLANYEEEFGPVNLDSNVFGFYFYRRNLEDLTDWVVRILYENRDDEQNRNDLEGIVEDCISGWPYLETTIREIDTKLAKRHVECKAEWGDTDGQ